MACETEQIVKDAAILAKQEACDVVELACMDLDNCLNQGNRSLGQVPINQKQNILYHCKRLRKHLKTILKALDDDDEKE